MPVLPSCGVAVSRSSAPPSDFRQNPAEPGQALGVRAGQGQVSGLVDDDRVEADRACPELVEQCLARRQGHGDDQSLSSRNTARRRLQRDSPRPRRQHIDPPVSL